MAGRSKGNAKSGLRNLKDAPSPYRYFIREDWAKLRADTPLTITEADLERLKGLNVVISLQEVEEIYLPLTRLLDLYVKGTEGIFRATDQFLGASEGKVPFIIGLAGSVAVGKSTSARVLQALLSRMPGLGKVDLITTDGFLYSNAILQREGLMERKGFPESYDLPKLLTFLHDIKAGKRQVKAPVYSHFHYDVQPSTFIEVDKPDILIVEGLNVLQTSRPPKDTKAIPFVSDFFDFSIYVDAEEEAVERWYIERFMSLRETAFKDPRSYFHRYSQVAEKEAMQIGLSIWRSINLVNLRENITPTRQRADLILSKGSDHGVDEVSLRKL